MNVREVYYLLNVREMNVREMNVREMYYLQRFNFSPFQT